MFSDSNNLLYFNKNYKSWDFLLPDIVLDNKKNLGKL